MYEYISTFGYFSEIPCIPPTGCEHSYGVTLERAIWGGDADLTSRRIKPYLKTSCVLTVTCAGVLTPNGLAPSFSAEKQIQKIAKAASGLISHHTVTPDPYGGNKNSTRQKETTHRR